MTAGSLTWFASHELRLAWRDWLSMMTAGRRGREKVVAVALAIFVIFTHVLAWYFVARYVEDSATPSKPALVVITGSLVLAWSLLISQAMESVTRAFYARSDLDLILSSPAAARKIFAVRIGAMALSVILMAALLGAPLINVLVARGGARWLGAYGVVIAMGATAAALSVAMTVALFRLIGPKRTRFVAQIVAAVIAAVFIIGLQVAAILSHGTLSRMVFLESDTLVALVPDIDSLFWWPARAALGDLTALGAVLGIAGRDARRRDRGVLDALRQPCHRGLQRRGDRRTTGAARRLPTARARAHLAAEGMDAAAARSLARLTDLDAAALSAAARTAVVAFLRRGHRRAGGAGARAGDGGGTTRRRARMARDFRRGRA
jgi:hypothetical protein